MSSILVLHSLVRWAIMLFGLWTVLNALNGVLGKTAYTPSDNRTSLFFSISCDIQLIIGLILYFNGPWFDKLKDLGNNMKDPYDRFFTMEHAVMMLIAWILVHIGRVAVKKASGDAAKHKRSLLFFGLVMALIIAAVPWPFRHELGSHQWFRWFN
jgi:hypothetical protein